MENYKWNAVKKLQELYCWSTFYKENQRENDFEKVRQEIKQHKEKYNLR